jgi:hypothetical protein
MSEIVGFSGPIYMTAPTKAVCPLLLNDFRCGCLDRPCAMHSHGRLTGALHKTSAVRASTLKCRSRRACPKCVPWHFVKWLCARETLKSRCVRALFDVNQSAGKRKLMSSGNRRFMRAMYLAQPCFVCPSTASLLSTRATIIRHPIGECAVTVWKQNVVHSTQPSRRRAD